MSKIECFECNKGELVQKPVELTGSRHGEDFVVIVDGLECTDCGHKTIDNNQSGEFTKAVSDAYRTAHGLLTTREIRDRRNLLGMTQQSFAEYLGGVGVASVKRWEQGQIQDRAMDGLIRLRTDPDTARRNLKELEQQVAENCVLGNAVLNGQNVELSVLLGRSYKKQTPIKLDKSSLSFLDDESVMAA